MNLEVRVLVTFYHPYAHVGGGAFRRFLGVKEVWEKMGVKMCILESSPKLITPSVEIPTPAATMVKPVPIEIVRGVFYIIFSVIYAFFLLSDFHVILCPNNDVISMISALVIGKAKKKKLVVTLHHIDIVSSSKRVLFNFSDMYSYARRVYGPTSGLVKSLTMKMNMALISKFDVCICVSRVFAGLFPNSRGSTNGIDARLLNRIMMYSGHKKKIYDAYYLGRLSPEKGVIDLLKIWEIINVHMKQGVCLMLIGPDQMGVNRYIDSYGLRDVVKHKGTVNEDNKLEMMMKARIFVTASRSEGWGVSIAEALLCGLPVVCFDILTLRAEWQKCPYVFFASDIRDFARKVVDVLSGGYRFDGREIRKWALNRLKTIDYVAKKDLEIILNIMGDTIKSN